MTVTMPSTQARTAHSRSAQALRQAVVRATLAPSVHNTQPWRFVIDHDTLEIHADWSRQLNWLDPTGRQLLISCGCALFNARVAVAAAGFYCTVQRFPDRTQPNLVARLTIGDESDEWLPIAGLNPVIELRRSNRRRFAPDPVPPDVIDDLVGMAASESALLFAVNEDEHRLTVARLSQLADREQNADPAYRAELRAWTTVDSGRRDGVPATAVPHADPHTHDDVPIRDFDTRGAGWLPADTHSGRDQCMLLLGTLQDRPAAWLRAGEALEHVLLETARRGFAASLLTQIVEIPRTRALLRHELRLDMNPHVLLRIGRAPRTPATRRRRLVDVLSDTG